MDYSLGGIWRRVPVDNAGTDPQTGQTSARMIRKVGAGFPTGIMRQNNNGERAK
jgi:hypothetical protein